MDTGIMTICMGVTKSYAGLVICRFLLGLAEAGFVPGKMNNCPQCQAFSDRRQAACT